LNRLSTEFYFPYTLNPWRKAGAILEKPQSEIILLENEPHVRNLLIEVFKAHGYSVRPFPGLEELEEMLGRIGSYAKILIAEINMLGINQAWANRIRADFPSLPILFLSGSAAESRAEGVNDQIAFLRNPFRLLDLIRRVEALISPGPFREEARHPREMEAPLAPGLS
jgi:DNA-binding response OmpR family regulator